jgi:hypothetical protein
LSKQPTAFPEERQKHKSSAFRVELSVKSACASSWAQPITMGIPFARELLKDSDPVSLRGPDGREIGLQVAPLAQWPDGSVKWLLLDFILPHVIQGSTYYELTPRSQATGRKEAPTVAVEEMENSVVVNTGVATFYLSRTRMLLDRAVIDDKDVLRPGAADVVLIDAKGKPGRPHVDRVSVETRGPVRATVKYEGNFTGRARCKFAVRYSFFAQTGLVRAELAIHNPHRARHRGGLWDLGDAGSVHFCDLALQFGLQGQGQSRIAWTAEPGQPIQFTSGQRLEIFQASSGGENWQSKNHANQTGKVPCPFRGYRTRTATEEAFGLRANPVLGVQGSNGFLAIAVPEFWQNFPKALEVDGREIRVRLFPAQWGDLFELQGGEKKTHAVWLHLGSGAIPAELPFGCMQLAPRVHASPDWYAKSRAIADLLPAIPDPDQRLQALLADFIGGANSFAVRREVIDEFGWRNWGELYADHEGAYATCPPPVISHYNNQYDVIYGALLQYLQTSDDRWFDLLDPLARHVIDIDIYHTAQDKAAYNGGLFWHTDHYKDAATCTHRSFSRSNQSKGQPYGGGPSNEHNYTTGLLHYYYLSGDLNAYEAVLELVDWVVHMDDGKLNLLGLLDEGPTGLASATRQHDYHGPGRGAGNSISALLDGWFVTGKRVYLTKAEELIRRCVHPHEDITSRDLLNVELRWSYTVFLAALGRYLGVKVDLDELDDMYAYTRASLIHFAGWMLENELPYFDHPDKLEFPTETWAAHEFRKANVMRLAAPHVEEPIRRRLLTRADDLTARAWTDLHRFQNPATARAIAILLVEGMRERSLPQAAAATVAQCAASFDFGFPQTFQSQRARVLSRLKTVGGLTSILLKLVDVRLWPTWFRLTRHINSCDRLNVPIQDRPRS